MTTPFELFKSNRVTDVKTVAEFLDRYYRPDKYTGRGEEYAAAILKSHEEDFNKSGVDCISKHDSSTGSVVSFYGNEMVE